ncbi:hypothetical protein ASG32_18615 [Methylobacterium sp. Leaf361]|uniref:hypothetical protein n=1 Tax=Methylobacterium sp. Leaf361 TaxID=1736352 RepID=UPI0006FAF127|nr:hypothetical protein [Methylobacterium sp. Leaf361]KQS85266.1 hypothetical protein ASG32_18615 [Methylobacterium sp. Leaf361]
MTLQLNRWQRRKMKRLTEEADSAVEGDRRFFDRHHARTYRLRLASQAERQQIELIQGGSLNLTPDQAAFVVMKQLAPGVRLKATVIGPRESIGEDFTDAEAGSVFEGYADIHPEMRQREAMMRAVYVRLGGTPPDQQEGGPQL